MGFFDVVYVVLDLTIFLVLFAIFSLTFLVMVLCLVPLFILQKCGVQLRPPFEYAGSNHKSDVLLLTLKGENGLYIPDALAVEIESIAKEYCKRNAGRIRCMISDESMAEEFATTTSKNPAEQLYWKILWKYPNPSVTGPSGKFHFHACLCVRREVNDIHVFDKLVKNLANLGMDVLRYETVREKVIEFEGDDRFERFAKLSFGRSTVWDLPTMQRMARSEALTVWGESANYPMLKRNIYWTTAKPESVPEAQTIAFFSYESHNSLEEMSFTSFTKRFYLWNQMCLLFSGFTTLLYSGLAPEKFFFAESRVSLKELQQHVGTFNTIISVLHRSCFSRRQAASNMSLIVRVRVFDYRDRGLSTRQITAGGSQEDA